MTGSTVESALGWIAFVADFSAKSQAVTTRRNVGSLITIRVAGERDIAWMNHAIGVTDGIGAVVHDVAVVVDGVIAGGSRLSGTCKIAVTGSTVESALGWIAFVADLAAKSQAITTRRSVGSLIAIRVAGERSIAWMNHAIGVTDGIGAVVHDVAVVVDGVIAGKYFILRRIAGGVQCAVDVTDGVCAVDAVDAVVIETVVASGTGGIAFIVVRGGATAGIVGVIDATVVVIIDAVLTLGNAIGSSFVASGIVGTIVACIAIGMTVRIGSVGDTVMIVVECVGAGSNG